MKILSFITLCHSTIDEHFEVPLGQIIDRTPCKCEKFHFESEKNTARGTVAVLPVSRAGANVQRERVQSSCSPKTASSMQPVACRKTCAARIRRTGVQAMIEPASFLFTSNPNARLISHCSRWAVSAMHSCLILARARSPPSAKYRRIVLTLVPLVSLWLPLAE